MALNMRAAASAGTLPALVEIDAEIAVAVGVEGNRISAASTIYSKVIIPQMTYKITQEGMDVDKAMAWAETEMKKLL